jgi:hypothetical protein
MRWLVLAALAACSQGPVRVYLDRATVPAYLDTDAAVATLGAAVGFWAACGFDVAIDTNGNAVRFDVLEQPFNGATASDGGVILSSWPDLFATDGTVCVEQHNGQPSLGAGEVSNRLMLGGSMRHELGHLLGQHHEPEEWSVMNASVAICVDRLASEACRK